MSRKKHEFQLMREIESQEEWEDIMGREGLWVIDVYQDWCGPCEAMISNFKRVKNELGDDLLHFASAKAESVECLQHYRGSCEPCFLFFAGSLLVSYVHGASSPLILRTLTEQLVYEHRVIEGICERREVKDPFVLSKLAAGDALRKSHDDDEPVEQGYTIAIIKPNIVAEGNVDKIIEEMTIHGIEILANEERHLTPDEVREFYSHLQNEDFFDDLVNFMSSGPSHVLVLSKGQADDSVITDWRALLGPPSVEDAKNIAPESLRARYGKEGLMNALHGSDSKEAAARELAFFFPAMETPILQIKTKEVQRTLALIRPDAFSLNRDEILQKIKEAGFQIALQKVVSLTKDQAADFYGEHENQPYFEELIAHMSSGPLLALGLARQDAVETWRGMLGPPNIEDARANAPESLRAQFSVEDVPLNQLHGSDSVESASHELEYFFPMEQTVAMIKPDGIGSKDSIIDKIHEAGFRIAARKETTITRDIAESFYEDQKDQEYFDDLVNHMISGPTVFMVLSREGAVDGWRQEIGPTDPERAKAENPSSLRAQFGSDLLHNAVHGCSNSAEVKKKIHDIFGNLDCKIDGTIQEQEDLTCGHSAPEDEQEIADTRRTFDDCKPVEETSKHQVNSHELDDDMTPDDEEKSENKNVAEADYDSDPEEKPSQEQESDNKKLEDVGDITVHDRNEPAYDKLTNIEQEEVLANGQIAESELEKENPEEEQESDNKKQEDVCDITVHDRNEPANHELTNIEQEEVLANGQTEESELEKEKPEEEQSV